MSWSVHHGSGKLLVFTNETGDAVTDVVMRLKGKALGGMFARRDWTMTVETLPDGGAVQAPFKSVMGAKSDPPRMEIEWTSPNGDRWQTILDDLPL